ncbi:hypothetical protein D3C78_1786870 [compost metagenome]
MKTRILDNRFAPCIQQQLGQNNDALHRTAKQYDMLYIRTNPAGNPQMRSDSFAKPFISFGGTSALQQSAFLPSSIR